MENAEQIQQRVVAAENAASVAHAGAEAALLVLLRRHRPGSPTVDAALAELSNRSDDYERACDATDRADAAYNEQVHQDILRDRRLRRMGHAEGILAAQHRAVAVDVQQEQPSCGTNLERQHEEPARTGEGQGSSVSLVASHARPRPCRDDVLPPAAKRLNTAEEAIDKTPSSEPRTLNRLYAWATGNLAATAAAAPAAAAENQGARSDEATAAGDQVGQWLGDDDSFSASGANRDQDEDQGNRSDEEAAAAGNQGAKAARDPVEQWFSDDDSLSARSAIGDQDEDQGNSSDEEKTIGDQGTEQGTAGEDSSSASDAGGGQAEDQGAPCAEAKAAGDHGTEQETAGEDSSASDAAADQPSEQSESPPASEYVPSEEESSTSE